MKLLPTGRWRLPVIAAIALLALPLLVLLAWVASNWVDDGEVPPPPQLQVAAGKAGSKFFFQMQGMLAPPGESAEAAGRRDWERVMQQGPAAAASAPPQPGRLAPILGLPLVCRAPEDCPRVLATSAAKIEAQLQPMTLLGQRCAEALADLRFEEMLQPTPTAETPLPSYQGAVQCGLWFKGLAQLAAAQGDRAAALQDLDSERRFADALLGGSRLLIGKMVGAAIARSHFDGVTAVALQRPDWAADLASRVGALPPGALDATAWIAMEATYLRGTIDAAQRSCSGGLQGLSSAPGGWFGKVSDLACHWGIGFLPNATRQALDRQWLEAWKLADQGLDMALDRSIAEQARAASAAAAGPAGLAWRNTIGQLLIDIASPSWAPYYARQADVELHRQALSLALTAIAQQVPLTERPAWLARQPLTQRMRSRLSWMDGNAALTVRPWMAEVPGNDPRRADYRIPVAAP